MGKFVAADTQTKSERRRNHQQRQGRRRRWGRKFSASPIDVGVSASGLRGCYRRDADRNERRAHVRRHVQRRTVELFVRYVGKRRHLAQQLRSRRDAHGGVSLDLVPVLGRNGGTAGAAAPVACRRERAVLHDLRAGAGVARQDVRHGSGKRPVVRSARTGVDVQAPTHVLDVPNLQAAGFASLPDLQQVRALAPVSFFVLTQLIGPFSPFASALAN